MTLRLAHRSLGLLLLAFITAHLGNHIALFWGVEQHLATQEALRTIYRNPVVEPILLAGFALQLFFGTRLLMRYGWPRRFWPRLHWISGIILVLFLVQHISAALYTRWAYVTVDTDIYWASSVVSRASFALYFVPYYALGVSAVFAHIAAAIALKQRRQTLAICTGAIGTTFAIALVLTLSGVFFAIDLPAEYETYLNGFSGTP